MSEFHAHRLFKKWAEISPKDFLQLVTLAKAKALLKNSESVFNTSLESRNVRRFEAARSFLSVMRQ